MGPVFRGRSDICRRESTLARRSSAGTPVQTLDRWMAGVLAPRMADGWCAVRHRSRFDQQVVLTNKPIPGPSDHLERNDSSIPRLSWLDYPTLLRDPHGTPKQDGPGRLRTARLVIAPPPLLQAPKVCVLGQNELKGLWRFLSWMTHKRYAIRGYSMPYRYLIRSHVLDILQAL